MSYYRIPGHWTLNKVLGFHPELATFLNDRWPLYVGRHNFIPVKGPKYITVDCVFGKLTSAAASPDVGSLGKAYIGCSVDPEWNQQEKNEWLFGEKGYWKNWNYGLKSRTLADLTMMLVEDLKPEDRNPERIVRHIAARISQANNHKGLLYGEWDAKILYNGSGTPPSMWNSTEHILTSRLVSGKPVKYAQCWIFTEVMVSMFRFLGIASRALYALNARIDKGLDGGIDMGLTFKGDGEVDVYKMLSLQSSKVKEIKYDGDEFILKGDSDLDLTNYVVGGDSIWNFHMIPEVYIPQKQVYGWSCLDACPSVKTTWNDEYAGQKVLGPCPVRDIKSANFKAGCDFDYFNSTFNAVFRYWKDAIILNDDDQEETIIYPYAISYEGTQDKQPKLMIKNPTTGKNIDVSSTYKPKNMYGVYHRSHPAIIKWENDEIVMYTQEAISTPYFVQLCCLNKKNRLLSCDRQIVNKWEQYQQPDIHNDTRKVSIVIVNLETKKWWASIAG